MLVLALDTALHACSVALVDHGHIRAHRFERRARGHAEALLPMVESARAEAGVDYRDLDLLAVTTGPGIFTGVRIGLAAARGLALAAGRPLLGVTTLEAIAAGVADQTTLDERPIYVAIDARRGELYGQAFAADLAPLGEPCLLSLDDVLAQLPPAPAIVAGSGARLIEGQLADRHHDIDVVDRPTEPDAAIVARIAAARGPPAADAGPVRPLYLRPPDATLPP